MRNGTIGTDGRVHCPYCNSVQVKEARKQPRKYPEPGFFSKLIHSNESTQGRVGFWLHGYDCKKCGNEFVLDPATPAPAVTTAISPEPIATYTTPSTPYTPEPVYAPPLPPAKKSGILGKLILGIVVLGLAFMAWSWYQSQNKPSKSKQVKAKTDTPKVTAKSATPVTDKKPDIVVPPEPPKAAEPTPEPTKPAEPEAVKPAPEPVKEPEPPKPKITKAEKGEVNIDYVEPVKITETKTVKAN